MIYLFLGFILLLGRFRFLTSIVTTLSRFDKMNWEMLFLLTLSLDRNTQRVYLLNMINRLLEGLIVMCLIMGIANLVGGEVKWLGLLAIGITTLFILSRLNRMKQNQGVLLTRLQSFLYFYEMELMKGSHQFLALREADRRTQVFGHLATVEAYIEASNQLYVFVRWMVIKKMAILFERNRTFSNQDLTTDFIQLAQELHQRFAQGERLRLERRENLMMIPMMLNMLLMMLYLIAPFIQDFLT